MAAMAAPALAQDGYDPGPPPPLPAWEEEDEYPDEEYLDEEDAWEQRSGHHGPPPHEMGYPPEQRAAWLEECRARYHDANGRARGQVIGGLLGAVAGGAAGGAIAEGDDNLGGTLGTFDRIEKSLAEGERWSGYDREAYLLRHEQSYRGYGPGRGAGAWGYHYPYPYPVMWARVPIVTERRDCGCETVVEEWVEEERAPPRARRAAPDKRVRITK